MMNYNTGLRCMNARYRRNRQKTETSLSQKIVEDTMVSLSHGNFPSSVHIISAQEYLNLTPKQKSLVRSTEFEASTLGSESFGRFIVKLKFMMTKERFLNYTEEY